MTFVETTFERGYIVHLLNQVRSLPMATLLLDSLPSLKKVRSADLSRVNLHTFQASNWLLDLYGDDLVAFRKHVKKYKQRGLQVKRKKEGKQTKVHVQAHPGNCVFLAFSHMCSGGIQGVVIR